MLDSIGQIPAEAARRFGDKLALIAPGRELSFNELNALSNRCANALVGLGVKAGDRVTLYSGNSWEWIVAYYGALKVGAVINPINVMLTPEEVGFVASDCGASVVLGSGIVGSRIKPSTTGGLCSSQVSPCGRHIGRTEDRLH